MFQQGGTVAAFPAGKLVRLINNDQIPVSGKKGIVLGHVGVRRDGDTFTCVSRIGQLAGLHAKLISKLAPVRPDFVGRHGDKDVFPTGIHKALDDAKAQAGLARSGAVGEHDALPVTEASFRKDDILLLPGIQFGQSAAHGAQVGVIAYCAIASFSSCRSCFFSVSSYIQSIAAIATASSRLFTSGRAAAYSGCSLVHFRRASLSRSKGLMSWNPRTTSRGQLFSSSSASFSSAASISCSVIGKCFFAHAVLSASVSAISFQISAGMLLNIIRLLLLLFGTILLGRLRFRFRRRLPLDAEKLMLGHVRAHTNAGESTSFGRYFGLCSILFKGLGELVFLHSKGHLEKLLCGMGITFLWSLSLEHIHLVQEDFWRSYAACLVFGKKIDGVTNMVGDVPFGADTFRDHQVGDGRVQPGQDRPGQ